MTEFENYIKSNFLVGNTKYCIREELLSESLRHYDMACSWAEDDVFQIGWVSKDYDDPKNLIDEIVRWKKYVSNSYLGLDKKDFSIKLAVASHKGKFISFNEGL